MKTLIFCFDGTCNNPEDVSDFFDDESISNILKLHILLGGKLSPHNDKSELIPAQHSFYYSGIGNRGNWLLRNINAAFAPTYSERSSVFYIGLQKALCLQEGIKYEYIFIWSLSLFD